LAITEEMNYGNCPIPGEKKEEDKNQHPTFPNGQSTLKFDEFINIIKESCVDKDQAENYLVYAFSMFDRKKYCIS
jgi:Ca2+-binding EF-hand superfamily protein